MGHSPIILEGEEPAEIVDGQIDPSTVDNAVAQYMFRRVETGVQWENLLKTLDFFFSQRLRNNEEIKNGENKQTNNSVWLLFSCFSSFKWHCSEFPLGKKRKLRVFVDVTRLEMAQDAGLSSVSSQAEEANSFHKMSPSVDC